MSSPPLSPQPPRNEEHDETEQQLQETREPVPMDQDPQTQIREIEDQPDQPMAPEEAEAEQQENPEAPKVQQSFTELYVLPPIIDPHVAVSESTVTTPSNNPHNRRVANKRKKGKPNAKKQQAIEKRLLSLMEKLNPIPLIPPKSLDFSKHEQLLKKLGLWDFSRIEFDTDVRVDLIAQLVATYDPKLRSSYVNDFRIAVNRADLARALKLPVKKEKGTVGGVESVDLDSEFLTDESKVFLEDFVSNCVLLHEDLWVTPTEVQNWIRMIKDGHPDRVDWATLFWFMMEKELTKGDQLEDCYYASHFQYLIKSQREEAVLLKAEETPVEKVELDLEEKGDEGVNKDVKDDVVGKENEKQGNNMIDVVGKEKEEEGNNMIDVVGKEHEEEGNNMIDFVGKEQEEEGNNMIEGPSIELTLGQDTVGQDVVDEEGDVKANEMIDLDDCEEDNEMGEEEMQGRWDLDGENNSERHFMEPCGLEGTRFDSFEDRNEDKGDMDEVGREGDEEGGDGLDRLEENGFTGNLLQTMEANLMGFGSEGQHHSTSMDLQADTHHMESSPPFFNNTGKRVIEHDDEIRMHSLNESNKRLRINEPWDHNPIEFGTCMDQMQHLMERAKAIYEEKEQSHEHLVMNQQVLLNELHKRDKVIEHLQRTKFEESQKMDKEKYRYERELYIMSNVLDGYRKALKETQKAFTEYRQKAQLSEESLYKDAGPGGLMLSTGEIEKIREKQEEEYRMNCLVLEQKAKEAEGGYTGQFQEFLDKINVLGEKLTCLERDAKELIDLYRKSKMPQTEEKVAEASEPPTEEKVAEASESPTEEKVAEASEPPPNE